MITLQSEISLLIPLYVSTLYGGIIGYFRETEDSPAGMRTYASVSLGACLFALVSQHAVHSIDPQLIGSQAMATFDSTRISAQVVSGIGFLGAGMIFRDGVQAKGLTSAAILWATAAIGLAVANELYIASTLGVFNIVAILALPRFAWFRRVVLDSRSNRIDRASQKVFDGFGQGYEKKTALDTNEKETQ